MVLDGELVAWRDGVIRPFADLQQRIGRKKLTPAILKSVPVRFLAYDLLEENYEDLRLLPLARAACAVGKASVADAPEVIDMSEIVTAESWEELAQLAAQSRARGVEGLMLKALERRTAQADNAARGGSGRSSPYSFDAVMLYAQTGAWPPIQPVHGLHVRRVERRGARAGGQGLLGTE